jgi:hypothetical protein
MVGLAVTALACALLVPAIVAGLIPGFEVASVSASCATSPSIEEAVLRGEVVFVGTVVATENDARWATVTVEERWSGARALGDTVHVHGGPEAGVATTIDRTYLPGRYLFVVRNGPGYLEDDLCTATTPWTADLARLRPAGVTAAPAVASGSPVSSFDPEPFLPVLALLAALLLAVASYVVILRARRRPPDWMR